MANDKNILDELGIDLSGDISTDGDFSLESILAEYKGSAFLDGDRKTPSDELQRKTDEILQEAIGAAKFRSAQPDGGSPAAEAAGEQQRTDDRAERNIEPEHPAGRLPDRKKRREESTEPESGPNKRDIVRHSVPVEPMEETPEPAYDIAPEIDTSVFDEPEEPKSRDTVEDFLNKLGSEPFVTDMSSDLPVGEYASADAADGTYEEPEDTEKTKIGSFFGHFGRRREGPEDESFDSYGQLPEENYDEDDGYVDIEPEPDLRDEAQRYASRVPSLRFRIMGATVLCVVLALFTYLYSTGRHPFGIESDASAVAFIAILELITIGLGLDVMIRGVEDIITLSPGTESLVLVSCIMSVLDAFSMLIGGEFSFGLPLGVVSSISLLSAMSARKSWYMALCDSMRTASSAASAYGVTIDRESMQNRNILKKVTGEPVGFYARLTSPDCGETFYDEVTPLLIVVAFVLSFLATVGRGNADAFTHTFSIMTAVAAAFPASVIFALPFKYAAINLKKAGGAIAGFEGAEEIFNSDGALITDLDIFPVGSVSMSGVKIFEGMDAQKVIAYTSSIIIASDSGLRKVFEEVLRTQGLTRRRVDDFACYDGGGISGLVEGQRVLVGTGAFMSLMGMRVPDNINATNSVFAAINDELAGVFSMSYVPSNSVQSALVALLGTRTNLLMAVRDFNITPNTIKQKFKVSMDGVGYLPIETTYELSQDTLPNGEGVSAILVRGGLAPFAEVITRGRFLKLISTLNMWVTGIGTAMAMIIMFYLCWAGAFASASAFNIFLFMSVIGLAVYIMSQGTRKRM